MISSFIRKILVAITALSLIATNNSFASEGQGVPIGEPEAVTDVTVGAFSAGSTNTTISWKVPANNGGSPILGYTATAMYGANFATAGVNCPASQPQGAVAGTTQVTCQMVGLSYGTPYKIRVVARNAVGGSPEAFSAEFTISASDPQTVTIDNAPSSVSFGSAGTQLAATVSTGRAVTWSTSTDSVCSVSNSGLVSYLSVGTCTVKATQDGTGSSYQTASAEKNISVTANVSVSATSATGISGSGATLRGTVPYPGANTSIVFCISTTDSTNSCTAPAGVSMSTASPATITSNSGSATQALVSGLSSNTTYYYWVEATVSGSVTKSTTSSFSTFSAATITLDGPTTGEQGAFFSTNVVASGGSGVFVTWGATSLPTGLTLTPAGTQATISGAPAAAGTYNSEVSVVDSNGVRAVLAINFTINAPPPAPTPETEEDFDTTNEPVDPEKLKAAEEAAKLADEAAKLAAEEAAKKAAEDAAKKAVEESIKRENAARTEVPAPILTSDGKPPKLEDKSPQTAVTATIGGVPVVAKVLFENMRTITIVLGDQSLIVQGQSPSGDIRDTTPNGVLKVVQEDIVKLQGFGLRPNSKATVWVFSTPTKLGEFVVKNNGTYDESVKIPLSLTLGEHILQVNGVTENGEVISFSLLMIVNPREGSTTTTTPPTSGESQGSQTNPSGTTPKLKQKTYAIFLAKNLTTLVKSELSRVKALRKVVRSSLNVSCVIYTSKKTISKKEKKSLLSQAGAVCSKLATKKYPVKSKSVVTKISSAPKIKRKTPASRPIRVDIRYSIQS